MITLTEAAIRRVREIAIEKGIANADYGLRLGVKGGGCSGLTYHIDLDTEPRDRDKVFETQGLKVFVDPKSFLYLNGTELDFVNELAGGGFKFGNPNVRKVCGCGESFTV